MNPALIADCTVVSHGFFIIFVTFGALFVYRYPRLGWLHLPAVAWASWISATAGVCPLTYFEHRMRVAAGNAVPEGTFVQRFLEPIIYPATLTPVVQILLGIGLAAINFVMYVLIWKRHHRQKER